MAIPMKLKTIVYLIMALILSGFPEILGLGFLPADIHAEEFPLTLDEILNRVEQQYAGEGFSARFDQTSIIKAIDIADTAQGRLLVKRPGKMRWEYQTPEKQTIITDGKRLWIYRPELNQVMIGEAPAYLGDGKGASFISNINLIREKFSLIMDKGEGEPDYIINLLPINKIPEVTFIKLRISKNKFEMRGITTYNPYGDETRIELSEFSFNQNLKDSLFRFEVPQGTDIIRIGE